MTPPCNPLPPRPIWCSSAHLSILLRLCPPLSILVFVLTLEVLPTLELLCPSFLPESSLPLQVPFPSDPLNPLWQARKSGFCLRGQASSALLESFPGESSNIKQMSEGIGNFAHFWGKLGPGFYMSNVFGVQNSTCPRLWLFTRTIFLFSNDHFKSF